jgi:hypothetical protein
VVQNLVPELLHGVADAEYDVVRAGQPHILQIQSESFVTANWRFGQSRKSKEGISCEIPCIFQYSRRFSL